VEIFFKRSIDGHDIVRRVGEETARAP
jgi:hypothetical protein